MSMFSIGLSGLNAAQNALNTTSNNISNMFTPGYNRELTQLGEGRAGGGVRVNDIERQFNTYVADQLNSAKTQSSALSTYYGQITQIDNLLADRAAGLAPLMQGFFSSLEDLAASPSDPAARQGVLGQANTLRYDLHRSSSTCRSTGARTRSRFRWRRTSGNATSLW